MEVLQALQKLYIILIRIWFPWDEMVGWLIDIRSIVHPSFNPMIPHSGYSFSSK